jgi:phosphohistidine phosphatase SixA
VAGLLLLTPWLLAVGQGAEQLSGAALVKTLQQGGYVLVMRHGATHADQADMDPWNLDNVAKQRQLNDTGRGQAKEIGAIIRKLKIPIASVTTSKFFRAQETGQLLEVGTVQTSLDISEGGLVVPPVENSRRTKALQALLATAPAAGQNTLLISHKPNIVDAIGKEVFDAREGECFVIKPDGAGRFTLVARIKADEWKTLVVGP